MYQTKDISRICRISFKQIKNYHSAGLLDESIFNAEGKLSIDASNLKRLFEIKTLQQICFSTRQIKILYDNNITDEAVKKMFDHFIDSYEKSIKIFLTSYDDAYLNKNFAERSLYGLFTHNNRVDNILHEMYEFRKIWYLDKNKKNFLRETRRKLFLAMEGFNYNEEEYYLRNTSVHFDKIYQFFIEEGLNQSYLFFISYMQWLTAADRYKRQMFKLIGIFNQIPLYELSLKWVAINSRK